MLLLQLYFFVLCNNCTKKHVITLTVDIEKVNMGNLESTCSFGQDPSIPNEVYTVDVNVRDTVVWAGKAINNRDIVEIKKMIY